MSLPISLKPVGVIPSHLGHKPLGKKVCYCRSLPSIFFILLVLGLAIVYIDEYNPSKIFKMASNSFEAMTNWQRSLLICHPFDCCKRGYVVLGLSNSSSLVVVCPSFPLTTSTLCGYRSDFNGRLEFSLCLCGPGHAVGLLYVHQTYFLLPEPNKQFTPLLTYMILTCGENNLFSAPPAEQPKKTYSPPPPG